MTTILLWILSLLCITAGLIGTILPALPGTPLVFLGLILAAWIDDFTKVGGWTLSILGVLTVLTLIVDFVASTLGAKKLGASSTAIVASTVGTFVGIFFGLPGLILGPFVGAILGELWADFRSPARRAVVAASLHAGKVGFGTILGLAVGIAIKLGITVVMLAVFAWGWLV